MTSYYRIHFNKSRGWGVPIKDAFFRDRWPITGEGYKRARL